MTIEDRLEYLELAVKGLQAMVYANIDDRLASIEAMIQNRDSVLYDHLFQDDVRSGYSG
jgi:allantoicase